MKNLHHVLRICALAAVVAGPAMADVSRQSGPRQRIDLDVADANPADVFGSFAKILKAKLDLSSAVTGRVTVRLQNVMLESAIDVVCESIGCRSELSLGEVPILRILPALHHTNDPVGEALRQSLESPISVSLKDAAAMDVLVTFSRILSAELEVQGGSSQTVTLELQGVPARQALDALAAILKVNWDLQERTVAERERRVLRISARKAFPPNPMNAPSEEKP